MADTQTPEGVENVGTWRVRLPGGAPLHVELVIDHGSAAAIVDFLSTIDPVQLEQTALNRLDCDSDEQGGVTAAMIRELMDRARD